MRGRAWTVSLAASLLATACTDRGGVHLPLGAECEPIFESELDCGSEATCGLSGDGRHVCMAYCDQLLDRAYVAPCGDGLWCTQNTPLGLELEDHFAACYVGGSIAVGAPCDPDRQDCVSHARCLRNDRAVPEAEHVCRQLCVPDGSAGDACAAGERCFGDRCAVPCTAHGACREGRVCSGGECRDARQLADCSYDRVPECPLGQVCVCPSLGACDEGFDCVEPTP